MLMDCGLSKSESGRYESLKLEISSVVGMVRKEQWEWLTLRKTCHGHKRELLQILLWILMLFHLEWLLGSWLSVSWARWLLTWERKEMPHLLLMSRYTSEHMSKIYCEINALATRQLGDTMCSWVVNMFIISSLFPMVMVGSQFRQK